MTRAFDAKKKGDLQQTAWPIGQLQRPVLRICHERCAFTWRCKLGPTYLHLSEGTADRVLALSKPGVLPPEYYSTPVFVFDFAQPNIFKYSACISIASKNRLEENTLT